MESPRVNIIVHKQHWMYCTWYGTSAGKTCLKTCMFETISRTFHGDSAESVAFSRTTAGSGDGQGSGRAGRVISRRRIPDR